MAGTAAGVLDRAFVVAVSKRSRGAEETLDHDARLARLAAIAARYPADALDDPRVFFRPLRPTNATPTWRFVRAGVWETAWPSGYEPFLEEVAAKWSSRIENRTARARLYSPLGPAPSTRPAVILVHGYMGGSWLFEENAWPIAWLVRRGLDVVLPVLPLHAGRAGNHRGAPGFPSSDPRLTNEGFGQAIADLRTLVADRRAHGAPHVGVVGMSLGGYTTALLATVAEPGEVDFVMPMIPLASIADFARDQGRLGDGAAAELQHAALDRAHRVVSPFARPSRISSARSLVVGAENDRITPIAHARRLAAHLGSELITMPGGHLLQLGRADAFRALAQRLENEGILGS